MNPGFLDGVARLSKWYFVEVPLSTIVWEGTVEVIAPGKGEMGRPRTGPLVAEGTPPPQEVRQLAGGAPLSRLAALHDQGRQQRTDCSRFRYGARDEQTWAASRP